MHSSKKTPFSQGLQQKIDLLSERRTRIKLGAVDFNSPLLLAPMSQICNAPFRLLMEELGAGGTVSELISCHGINYGNQRTREMLRLDPREECVGIQLFGEEEKAMASAALVAQEFGPKFIDINMGCPVRKVVSKGGGSALLKETAKLGSFFRTIKAGLEVPLTIKIRTGWDAENLNADEVIHIAREEGVEFVAIHGRTRTQQYTGEANWDYLETMATLAPLPIIGNGDLHSAMATKARLESTSCQALMLGRGPLRDPFIFLKTYEDYRDEVVFTPRDYLEIIDRLVGYMEAYTDRERTLLIQTRKHIMWFAAGFGKAGPFRNSLFAAKTLEETLKLTSDYFLSLGEDDKELDLAEEFMTSGHG